MQPEEACFSMAKMLRVNRVKITPPPHTHTLERGQFYIFFQFYKTFSNFHGMYIELLKTIVLKLA